MRALLWMTLVPATVICGCGSDDIIDGQDSGNTDGSCAGLNCTNESGLNPDATRTDAPAMCQANGASCSKVQCAQSVECCSHNCANGVCVAQAACLPAAATCDPKNNACCSGRCEPVFGQANVTKCADVCVIDKGACTKAIDCCSLGCWNGKCGTPECTLEGAACAANSDCCSNNCDPQTKKCGLDPLNTMCRGTGESCNSGPQMGCCSGICDKTQNPERCGSTACKPEGATCTVDANCCHGICDPQTKVCKTPCTANAGTCATNCDCCSGNCTTGTCNPPVNPCVPLGQGCTTGADCCSDVCIAGSCGNPPPN